MALRQSLKWILLLAAVLPAAPLRAMEPAGLRALQTGPAGEGVAFMDLGAADGELLFHLITTDGDERFGTDNRRVEGQASRLYLASGFGVNPDLDFVIQLVHSTNSLTGELTTDPVVKSELSGESTEIMAGPSLWFGNIMLGAHASVLAMGEEKYDDGQAVTTTGSVTMPRLRLYTAIKADTVTAMARLRLYNDARASLKGETKGGDPLDTDVKRRSPAESSVDIRLQVDRQLAMAGTFTFVGAGRAAEDSARDYFIYGMGGLYAAAPWLSLSGGARYTEPHFYDDEDASVFADNLGGVRMDLGAHYSVQEITGNFGLGYTIPNLATYEDKENEYEVKIERAQWDLALGMILRW